MRELLTQFFAIINMKMFLILLFLINLFGTIYGYIWYRYQLADTEPQFYIFVPDSPTASLFFTIALVGWIFGRHYKLMEALAVVTLIKYGVWAVVMNLLTFAENGELSSDGWMLVASHGLMAVQAFLYASRYKYTYVHVFIAAVWTLHNDVIDYVFGQMPFYHVINQYPDKIGYFTFWLSIGCIYIAYFFVKRRQIVA
jgi:uncharacterized membrane protein YpjA